MANDKYVLGMVPDDFCSAGTFGFRFREFDQDLLGWGVLRDEIPDSDFDPADAPDDVSEYDSDGSFSL